jgi:biopolymer transport protein ExbB/TolQ
MLVEHLMQVTLLGTEWVLYLLISLSVVSVALMVERVLFFRANRQAWDKMMARVEPLIHAGDGESLSGVLRNWPGPEADVLRAGVEGARKGRAAAGRLVHAALLLETQRLDRRLAFLGTLGNNAPFLGLFGTVLGIIRAFHDLSLDVKGGANVVMSGISEALIATAAGLFVAIPAVIAFNAFQRRVSKDVTRAEAAADRLLALVVGGDGSEGTGDE